ncbi:hypothetical protein ScPMuIL_010580 [Solemya velum]
MASIWTVAYVVSCFKLFLIPTYRSTDFEVHRNWLAITHSLPFDQWYYERTSEWTLDYPPLFAWMEFLLGKIARYFDKEMLVISNLNYASDATILFQRLSVIVTDFVFIYAIKQFCDQFVIQYKKDADRSSLVAHPPVVLAILIMANCGLFMVDHILSFSRTIQLCYNGFLFGILVLSILRMYQGRHLESAFWFAVLLNLKHIYLYIAPAYFVYLLRCYCFQSYQDGRIAWRSFSITRLVATGIVVITVFLTSLGPFIYLNQLPQVLSRLFPFKRGLCHAYWAPNLWALYNMADKGAAIVGSRLGLVSRTDLTQAVMTGGLVQEYKHVILPAISPVITVIATGISIMPALLNLWLNPRGPQSFLRAIVLCAFGSFMFGWHVHEKAILLIIIPLSLLVMERKRDAQAFLVLSVVGHYSLFPLLFMPTEIPIKVLLLISCSVFAFISLGKIYNFGFGILTWPLLTRWETLYLMIIPALEAYNTIGHPLLGLSQQLPFLPLMLTSVYCALGVSYCWIKFYVNAFSMKHHKHAKQS